MNKNDNLTLVVKQFNSWDEVESPPKTDTSKKQYFLHYKENHKNNKDPYIDGSKSIEKKVLQQYS